MAQSRGSAFLARPDHQTSGGGLTNMGMTTAEYRQKVNLPSDLKCRAKAFALLQLGFKWNYNFKSAAEAVYLVRKVFECVSRGPLLPNGRHHLNEIRVVRV